jgi:hypothetical protein
VILCASGFAFYAFARQYGRPWAAAAGAVLYMLAPYHFEIDLWHRQAVGEFTAYVWMPLVLLSLNKALSEPRWLALGALSYAGLVVSHLPATLLFSLFLPVFVALQFLQVRSARPLVGLVLVVALGIALGSLYLLPAVKVSAWDIYSGSSSHQYHDFDNWMFFDGKDEPDPYLGNRLVRLLVALALVVALLAVAVFRAQRASAWRRSLPWLAALTLVLVMVSPLSIPVWRLLPFLQQVQFPWRIMIVSDIAMATMLVAALETLPARTDRIAWGALVAAGVLIVLMGASGWRVGFVLPYFMPPEVHEAARKELAAGADTPEYMTASMTMERGEFLQLAATLPQAAVKAGAGSVGIVSWRPRHIRLHVALAAAAPVTVKQIHIPPWRASVARTGAELPVTPAPGTGLLVVSAPAGTYDIDIELPTLPQERLGYLLGLGSLAAMIALLVLGRRLAPAR